MIKRLYINLIAWLLHNANSNPPTVGRNEFYWMKTRILQRHGIPGRPQWQHFPAKECWHCTRPRRGYCEDCEEFGQCCRCDGSRIYAQESWVRLIDWRLGRYLFHCPAQRVYEKPSKEVRFEGKILHASKPYLLPEESRMWLELIFNTKYFFANLGRHHFLGRYPFYGKLSVKRPLVSLRAIAYTLRFDRWRLIKAVLPKSLYLKWRDRVNADSIPF